MLNFPESNNALAESILSNKLFSNVRTIVDHGKILFNAADVALALGYPNPGTSVAIHCRPDGVFEREWVSMTIDQHGKETKQVSAMSFIDEANVCRLITHSKIKEAEEFEAWLFDEVLPTIRKTGGYIPVQAADDEKSILAKAIKIAERTIVEKEKEIAQLKPKAQCYDLFLESPGFVSLNKAAKSLCKGRNKMMAFLRAQKVLFKDGDENLPFQQYCDAGYFTVDQKLGRDGVNHSVTKVSAKGIAYIKRLYDRVEMAA